MDETADAAEANHIFMAKIIALEAVIHALIATHPNIPALAQTAHLYGESAVANLLTRNWTDVEISRVEKYLKSLLLHAT